MLSNNNNELFLVADKALDDKKFNTTAEGNTTWENSSIRKWLNNEFINRAFTKEQQKLIISSNVNNSISGGNNTKDKVFLLSETEITNTKYGFIANSEYNSPARRFEATTYAEANGLQIDEEINTANLYWLRTPASEASSVEIVYWNGSIHSNLKERNKVDYTRSGVIPAIKIKYNTKLVKGKPLNPIYKAEKLANYSYVELGSYPQDEIKEAALTEIIKNAVYNENGDAVIGNIKVRKVSVPELLDSKDVTNAIKKLSYDKDGYYKVNGILKYRKVVETSGTTTNEYYYKYSDKYYKYSPIKWRVLDNSNGRLKLIVDKSIAASEYYGVEGEEVFWETSSLRSWLNNEFYNITFTEDERQTILKSNVQLKDSEVNEEIKGGNSTIDNVYLLSVEDVRNKAYGFNSAPIINSASRKIKPTDYALALAANSWKGYINAAEWWTRSPANYTTNPVTVYQSGIVRSGGRYDIYELGVAPVIEISENKLIQIVKQ